MAVTGGDVLVAALRAAGVDTVFGLPGFQLDSLFDALAREAGIRLITTRHEQATSYMADGYARTSGRLGVCIVVPGPGLLNAMAGLATAYACNSRVLCIAGQVDSQLIDQGLGLVHEIRGQLEIERAVAKSSLRAGTVEEVGPATCEAIARVDFGRPRPVVLEVPLDVLAATLPAMPAFTIPPAERAEPDAGAVAAAAEMLSAAERPLIVAGGGVLAAAAWDPLRAVAERLQAPVVMTMNGKGALSADHALAFEADAIEDLLPAADVVLAVGTRFARHLGRRRRLEPNQTLVRIDVDPAEIELVAAPGLALVADAASGLSSLDRALAGLGSHAGWDDLERVRDDSHARAASLRPQADLGGVLAETLPPGAIVVAGMTQIGYWLRIGLPVREPRTWLTPGYQATLGFEVPTGLGAQVARPDRRVIVVCGDGGFLFNLQELATAVQHRIGAVFVVFNDGAYGNVRRTQRLRFEGRVIGSELHNPDFVRLAESFGMLGLRADGGEGLRRALRTALDQPGPALVEVPVAEMADPWSILLRT